MSDEYNYGFKLKLMCKDVKNARPILGNGLYYNNFNVLLQKYESSPEDYTTIVKRIEKLNDETFL